MLALIIGGCKGIGRAIALKLAQEGYDIAISYANRVDAAQAVAKEAEEKYGRKCWYYQAQLEIPGEGRKLFKKAVEDILEHQAQEAKENTEVEVSVLQKKANLFVPAQRKKLIAALKKQMEECAERLEYEQAAAIRDKIIEIEQTYGK